MTDSYTPVSRDRAAEQKRCEREIPSYRQQRHVAWREIREEYLSDPDVRREYENQASSYDE